MCYCIVTGQYKKKKKKRRRIDLKTWKRLAVRGNNKPSSFYPDLISDLFHPHILLGFAPFSTCKEMKVHFLDWPVAVVPEGQGNKPTNSAMLVSEQLMEKCMWLQQAKYRKYTFTCVVCVAAVVMEDHWTEQKWQKCMFKVVASFCKYSEYTQI